MVARVALGIGAVFLVAIAAWLLLPFGADDRELGHFDCSGSLAEVVGSDRIRVAPTQYAWETDSARSEDIRYVDSPCREPAITRAEQGAVLAGAVVVATGLFVAITRTQSHTA